MTTTMNTTGTGLELLISEHDVQETRRYRNLVRKNKKRRVFFRLGLSLFIFLLLAGSIIARRATAAPRISEEEAIAVATGGEIGPNDFRISDAGADLDSDGEKPAVVYNSTDNEYLVVWEGDDVRGALTNGEYEIYGQRVDAATGQEVGPNDFRISDMGPDGDGSYDAFKPAVAYNPDLNQYLVVWEGDDDTGTLVDNDFEIHGQLLQANGSEIGDDFLISYMGNYSNLPPYSAYSPAVAYNPAQDQYLVVWEGQEKLLINGQPADEYEIFGRLIEADGTLKISKLRISDLGPDGDPYYWAENPAVIYNPTANQYLVLWNGDDDTGNLVQGKKEIYGQLLDASGGEIGAEFRVSTTGADNDVILDSTDPAGTYNPDSNQFLVVWQRDHSSVGNEEEDDEHEIYGQLLQADGTEIGNDFRISDMGPDGVEQFDAEYPAVTYNAVTGQYLVVWDGDDNGGDLLEDHQEIFGQLLEANGQETGENDFRITYTGPDSDPDFDTVLPAVAYNPVSNHFFVASQSDLEVFPGGEEDEIVGQLLAANGDDAGTGSVRLSNMGADENFHANDPAVAYNSVDNEYLVVWSADDNISENVDNELEIRGQRIDAATGAEVGLNDFRISRMGPDKNANYQASSPAVAYNARLNQYLVVWGGNEVGLGSAETEIYGQILKADGAEIGEDDFRISYMEPDGNNDYEAYLPDVAYNATTNQYIVVWSGRTLSPALSSEYEVFGRLLKADGAATGNQFPISDMGQYGVTDGNGYEMPAVAYNPGLNQYLVVWTGFTLTTAVGEREIYGQLLDATGVEIGDNDFRISDMGPEGDTNYVVYGADVAHNPITNQYLVVWGGADDESGLREHEIYGQLLQADGAETGVNDFRISDMWPDGDTSSYFLRPAVAHDATANHYLVIWSADDNRDELVPNEYEIFGQALLADGTETGENDMRLSDMGPDGDVRFEAYDPAIACSTIAGQCLAVWESDDDTIPLVNDEFEIFGQLYDSGTAAPPLPPSAHQIFLPLVTR